MNTLKFFPASLMGLTLVVAVAACDDETRTIFGPDPDRIYVQVERLGNPLVSEVMFPKRNHGFHNSGQPSTDVVDFKDDVEAFVRDVAGRRAVVQTTLSSVLLPDMLVVQTQKSPGTAGWLAWALADGYGGRKLSDDVVDAGLMAIFGSLLDSQNVSPGLTTDNVNANDRAFAATFPYLAEPHR
jgi:hypothetical protein